MRSRHLGRSGFRTFPHDLHLIMESEFDTVDGRNPAQIDKQFLPLKDFILHVGWCGISSINSHVFLALGVLGLPRGLLMLANLHSQPF